MSVFDQIDVGSFPGDNTGDDDRDAWIKVNDNFAKAANIEEDNSFAGNVTISKFLTLGPANNVVIVSGAITATESSMGVGGEGGGTDDLTTINTAASAGAILILKKTGSTITVTETGNIILGATTRILTSGNDRLMLEYDGVSWVELSFSDNA